MLTSDWLLILGLLAFVVAWFARTLSQRSSILLICAALASVSAIVGVLDLRWQAVIGLFVGVIFLIVAIVSKVRSKPSNKIPFFSGILMSVFVLVAIAPLYYFPIFEFDEPSGEYAVGVRDTVFDDASRTEVFGYRPGDPRKLLVRVWYPADQVEGLSSRSYFTDQEAKTTARSFARLFQMPEYLFQHLKHVETKAYIDAPVAALEKPAPTIFFSHGYGMFAGQNTALMMHLASHGYIVYSIQHSLDSADVVLPDGEVISTQQETYDSLAALYDPTDTSMGAQLPETYSGRYAATVETQKLYRSPELRLPGKSAPVWLADRLFLLDALESGQIPSAITDVAAKSQFSAVGQMGMSFGGSTTGGLCMIDKRCVAAINLDGGDYHGTPFGGNIPVPFLMLYSDYEAMYKAMGYEGTIEQGYNDFSYERLEVAGLRGDVYRARILNSSHMGMSDLPLAVRQPLSSFLFGSIDGREMIDVVNASVLAFFDHHLLEVPNDFPSKLYQQYQDQLIPQGLAPIREWWVSENPEDQATLVQLEADMGPMLISLYSEKEPEAVEAFLLAFENGDNDMPESGISIDLAHSKGAVLPTREVSLYARTDPGDQTEFFLGLSGALEGRDDLKMFGRVLSGFYEIPTLPGSGEPLKNINIVSAKILTRSAASEAEDESN